MTSRKISLEYWRIIALIGIIVFLFSLFSPLVSLGGAGVSLLFTYSVTGDISLPDNAVIRATLGHIFSVREYEEYTQGAALKILITMILFPIALAIGFISLIINHKMALVSGMLGIICWLSSIWAVMEIKSMAIEKGAQSWSEAITFGSGIIVGIVGAVVLIISYFIGLLTLKEDTLKTILQS